MTDLEKEQGTNNPFAKENFIDHAIRSFIIDRKIQNLSAGTIVFYEDKLKLFVKFCNILKIKEVSQVDVDVLRRYLAWLVDTGHNPGGQHAAYRAVKTFLRWWQSELEPEGWKNPTIKVKAPKLEILPLEPISNEHVRLLLSTCDNKILGLRDRAIIICLLDTGCRAAELLDIRLDDVDASGSILIRKGKGRKPRSVFIGSRARKALRKYLFHRSGNSNFLWISLDGSQLSYWGLRDMLTRRSKMVGIKTPQIHAFRRAFALEMLRAGTDIYTLQKLMGHSDLTVLMRYLNLTNNDLQTAHNRASPGDAL